MRRLIVIGVLTALGAGVGVAATTDATDNHATLRIVAPADMEFRTLGLSPSAFTGPRVFQHLKSGVYVVVQAPPYGSTLSISCTDGESDQHTLDGDDVTCTYSP